MHNEFFSAHFKQIIDCDQSSKWQDLSAVVGNLIKGDPSLRGDLAHLFLYFQSISAIRKLSINATVIAVQDFQTALAEISNLATVEIKNKQTIRKFILRETNEIIDFRAYTTLVMFLVGAALSDAQKFFSHFTYHEIGGLKTLISRLHTVMASDQPSLSAMIRTAEEFVKIQPSRKTIKHDLGGMMELGNYEPSALWGALFRKTNAEISAFTSRPSLEKHFICYRYSSFGNQDRIVKSFLILQSPGSIREYFTFKVFYKSNSNETRKSAGAIVKLGDVVSCFGSSRMLMPSDGFGGLDSDASQILGPKTITLELDSLSANDPIVPGHLLTVNENKETISCRMVCVQTHIQHSDDAKIGSSLLSECDDDLGNFTVFGEGQNAARSEEERAQIWQLMIACLKRPGTEHVCTSLTKRDIDLRSI